jgi:hypothetical protein
MELLLSMQEIKPLKTGAYMAKWLYYAWQRHSVFMKTLAIVVPLEIAFILTNNIMWGIHHSYEWRIL